MIFVDRADAGRALARRLTFLEGSDAIVTGLPRGGVPVASEVAKALHAPLDVILVRKVGVPFQPELAMGAIGEDGIRVVNTEVLRAAQVTPEELQHVEQRERAELERRTTRYRAGRVGVPLAGRTVVIVDDGIATGSTARAACQVARAHGATRIVLAVPVASRRALELLAHDADDIVCLEAPESFGAVGQFYDDFSATSDDEVIEHLRQARRTVEADASGRSEDPPVRDEEVHVAVDHRRVTGHLTVPTGAEGFVIFAHGSGSSRHSSRNRFVASALNETGLATLLFDLLTPEEEQDRANVFDIELLADRLLTVGDWLRRQPEAQGRRIGYFGASTGAGAALWAAADQSSDVAAVVSRGGRPDLAAARLTAVRAPTLLIVGGDDDVVLELNRDAKAQLTCESELVVVPGATHLFQEPGTLDEVARLAQGWFALHLAPPSHGRASASRHP